MQQKQDDYDVENRVEIGDGVDQNQNNETGEDEVEAEDFFVGILRDKKTHADDDNAEN